jgi:dihydrofolate reductase
MTNRSSTAVKSANRIQGFAIVSEDGMLANAAGVMPDSLKFEADQAFFEQGLDRLDVVVHGRNSHEHQRRSDLRCRLILTHRVSAIAPDPTNKKALFWNPAGVSLEQAMAALDVPNGSVAVIGGTQVFGLFLDRYDIFYLSRAPGVRLPGGRPVFPEVPAQTPEEVLARHGLEPGQRSFLDVEKGLTVVGWYRPSKTEQDAVISRRTHGIAS